ncbi:hypothetical protein KH5H1_72400 [Corallococcus caeni]|nr:hypothetical protein KH5H1_72400 [Corallococcus sp. KH5-1]
MALAWIVNSNSDLIPSSVAKGLRGTMLQGGLGVGQPEDEQGRLQRTNEVANP